MSNTFARDPEPLVQYGGDGSRTTFPFPFPVLAADDLLVYIGENPATRLRDHRHRRSRRR